MLRLLNVLNLESIEGAVVVINSTRSHARLLLVWLLHVLRGANVSSFLLLLDDVHLVDLEHLVAIKVTELTLVTDLSEGKVVVVASLANPITSSLRG